MDEIEAANKKATGAALSIKNNQVMNPSKSWADNVIFNPDMSVEANRKAFEECFPQLAVLFEHRHWTSYIRGWKGTSRVTQTTNPLETLGVQKAQSRSGGAKSSLLAKQPTMRSMKNSTLSRACQETR
mmetsp:Transcript_30821/g.95360  ORF Transcript_30821/g.95360 Transcript_30821/m.95360 type:complete len:128 (-) Transcript_30821:454-837(-)